MAEYPDDNDSGRVGVVGEGSSDEAEEEFETVTAAEILEKLEDVSFYHEDHSITLVMKTGLQCNTTVARPTSFTNRRSVLCTGLAE